MKEGLGCAWGLESHALQRKNDLCGVISGRGVETNTHLKSSWFSYVETSKQNNQKLHSLEVLSH